jgi:tyrosinase
MAQSAGGNEGQTLVHDWTCRIHCKKHELGGSYWVVIFLGEVPDDPKQWRTCPSFVGGHYVFVSSGQRGDTLTEGFVHLNNAIASRSGLSSFEPNVVVPYLQDNLEWRIEAVRVLSLFVFDDRRSFPNLTPTPTSLQANRTAVDFSRLPSLEVTVSSTHLTYTPGSSFPEAGEPHYHHHITYGRPGGARHAQA